MIIAAAIRFPAHDPHNSNVKELICFIPKPARHHNILHSMWQQFADGKKDRTHASYAGEVQGFLTDTGAFLDRRASLLHARECGQVLLRKSGVGYQGDELFSEDLW